MCSSLLTDADSFRPEGNSQEYGGQDPPYPFPCRRVFPVPVSISLILSQVFSPGPEALAFGFLVSSLRGTACFASWQGGDRQRSRSSLESERRCSPVTIPGLAPQLHLRDTLGSSRQNTGVCSRRFPLLTCLPSRVQFLSRDIHAGSALSNVEWP